MVEELRERLDIAIENDVFVGAKERIEGWERYGYPYKTGSTEAKGLDDATGQIHTH